MDDNIPNIFMSAKLQEAFGLYWEVNEAPKQ